ncbi:hypothetical protein NSI01_48500 [Pimelobacter simplex]|nr:hypothetical protein NSI01_48500 [Pimelobacter simplex]
MDPLLRSTGVITMSSTPAPAADAVAGHSSPTPAVTTASTIVTTSGTRERAAARLADPRSGTEIFMAGDLPPGGMRARRDGRFPRTAVLVAR